MGDYCIKDGYIARLNNRYFNDTQLKDEWQKEVYEKARELADSFGLNSILDIGTGSGYKLLKYFSDKKTLGTDVRRTVVWLKQAYPDRNWTYEQKPHPGFDLVICSDVIEHVPDPDQLLDLIQQGNPKYVVFSTPDRAMLTRGQDGPPGNKCHVREWTFEEFAQYIGRRFSIIEHFISNIEQCTQVIIARRLT